MQLLRDYNYGENDFEDEYDLIIGPPPWAKLPQPVVLKDPVKLVGMRQSPNPHKLHADSMTSVICHYVRGHPGHTTGEVWEGLGEEMPLKKVTTLLFGLKRIGRLTASFTMKGRLRTYRWFTNGEDFT